MVAMVGRSMTSADVEGSSRFFCVKGDVYGEKRKMMWRAAITVGVGACQVVGVVMVVAVL